VSVKNFELINNHKKKKNSFSYVSRIYNNKKLDSSINSINNMGKMLGEIVWENELCYV
jgi:hypothetical protein